MNIKNIQIATNTSPPLYTFCGRLHYIILKQSIMNFPKLIWSVVFSAVIVFACRKPKEVGTQVEPSNPYDSTTLSKCFSCTDEKPYDTLTNVKGKIIRIYHDSLQGFEYSWGITLMEDDFAYNNYTLNKDSIVAPCPVLDPSLRKPNQKVLLSGVITTCNNLFSCPYCRYRYGRKLIVQRIRAL
jgi:hypothetical protein